MRQLGLLLITLSLSLTVYAVEKPQCLSFAGEEKCGYGCIQKFGQIYCGDKPGMTCLEFAGEVKCGFDCKQFAGQIKCGTVETDNCVVLTGEIKCGKACRANVGEIVCEETR